MTVLYVLMDLIVNLGALCGLYLMGVYNWERLKRWAKDYN